jgi:hypothetical protein
MRERCPDCRCLTSSAPDPCPECAAARRKHDDATPPLERPEIGHHDGETCGRWTDNDDSETPTTWPCDGVMEYAAKDEPTVWTRCDTCGEIGEWI